MCCTCLCIAPSWMDSSPSPLKRPNIFVTSNKMDLKKQEESEQVCGFSTVEMSVISERREAPGT